MEEMSSGWHHSPDHGQFYQVIEAQTLWGETTCCVWLPWCKRNTKRMKGRRVEADRAGFKKAWQDKSEEGYRTIIEVAKKIPENVLQEDPKLFMWYDQATTRIGG